jgi:hypothetical protein
MEPRFIRRTAIQAGGKAESTGHINPIYGAEPGKRFYTHISDEYTPFSPKVCQRWGVRGEFWKFSTDKYPASRTLASKGPAHCLNKRCVHSRYIFVKHRGACARRIDRPVHLPLTAQGTTAHVALLFA